MSFLTIVAVYDFGLKKAVTSAGKVEVASSLQAVWAALVDCDGRRQ